MGHPWLRYPVIRKVVHASIFCGHSTDWLRITCLTSVKSPTSRKVREKWGTRYYVYCGALRAIIGITDFI